MIIQYQNVEKYSPLPGTLRDFPHSIPRKALEVSGRGLYLCMI